MVPRVHSPGSVAGGWGLVLLALDVSCLERSLVPGVMGLDRLDIPSLVRGLVLMVGDVGLFGRLVDIVMDWGLVVVLVRRLVPRALIPVLRVRWAVHGGQEPD